MTKEHEPVIDTRVCNTCEQEFPATLEYFFKQKNTNIGLKSKCKPCQLEYNKKIKKNPYEPVIVKTFWKKYEEEELMAMSDEQVMQLIDDHVQTFMDSWQKRNKGKDFPNLEKGTMADIRNKRTDARKAPIVGKR